MDKIDLDNEKFKKDLNHYRRTMCYLEANVPIQVLCLPKVVENALIREGCVRIYDLFDRDLAKIKGIGKSRVSLLTSRLDEFLTVSI